MELLIFRHGPAGDKAAWKAKGRPDSERPLTAEGEEKTAKAAAGLEKLLGSLDVIAQSPLVRAKQTADLLAEAFPKAKRFELEELSPEEPARSVIRALEKFSGKARVALVGHEPQHGALIAELIGDGSASLELKKAGAALLEVEELAAGGAKLLWLLQPSQLRALR